ncbi:MAG: hypothetical protein AAF591_12885 [Verrucomicrobiota bacterium]
MSSDLIATVFSRGKRYSIGRSSKASCSYFGGPGYDVVIEGPRYGPRRLHHILTFNHPQFGINAMQFGSCVSLYYGICFEGCELEWDRTATAAIRISKISPRKSGKEYPYFGYPDVLPYIPLEIIEEAEVSDSEIKDCTYNTGWEIDARHVYAVAYSSPNLGVSLFGPDSEVEIVFEYDTSRGRVRAASQTD